MMQQVQPKSAATRADATTVRSSSWPIRRVGTLLSTGSETGASLAELMNRMGHSSTGAAQVYLHARAERGQQIAATLDKMARRELSRARKRHHEDQAADKASGTQRARKPKKAS